LTGAVGGRFGNRRGLMRALFEPVVVLCVPPLPINVFVIESDIEEERAIAATVVADIIEEAGDRALEVPLVAQELRLLGGILNAIDALEDAPVNQMRRKAEFCVAPNTVLANVLPPMIQALTLPHKLAAIVMNDPNRDRKLVTAQHKELLSLATSSKLPVIVTAKSSVVPGADVKLCRVGTLTRTGVTAALLIGARDGCLETGKAATVLNQVFVGRQRVGVSPLLTELEMAGALL
jgi:hypothetical protein